MMNKVSVLSPDVIAKIAAGEVVDRPSSVIKELLENSLDAGATSIEVHLKDAGKELIHIKDNGCGIAKADLERLFQRHATSKIRDITDLERLNSMGFRGEALYSIAAVSDVTLRSQAAGSPEAWTAHVRGGTRTPAEPAAPSGTGTDIKVAELFYNLPARRKFLKSNTSEISQVAGIIIPYALIYPEKKFLLSHAGRTMIDLRPAPSRLERAAQALNLDPNDLIELTHDFTPEQVSVKAILGTMNVQRPRRNLQYILINNRPVESKALGFAMNDVYRALLPPGVYPAFVLDITLDPANVDVNIHPSKREVRIRDEARLCSMVRHLVHNTLMQQNDAREVYIPSAQAPAAASTSAPDTQLFESRPLWSRGDGEGVPADKIIFAASQMHSYQQHAAPAADLFYQPDENLQARFSRARYIGAFIRKYLLFEEGASLFLVDQHAAQERIMFEKIQRQMETGTIETQPLLTPLLIKLNVQEQIQWEETKDKLAQVGIEADLFDQETLAVHAQPALFKNIENTVRSLLEGDAIKRGDRAAIARRACKASIVTGDYLSPEQVDHQRRQLLACREPFTCPHGRPTMVELKEAFLDRQFLRT